MSLSLFKVHLPRSVDEPLLNTLHSGFIGQGPRVEEFERDASAFLNVQRILSINSATSAIHLALHLSGVEPGDTVISTPMTCTATNMPITASRFANIVWCDIDPATGNLDHTKLSKLLAENPKCKAVICVAWTGYPCEFDELHAICREHGVKLIVDGAHGLGMEYRSKRVFGDFTVFSLQAIKHITTGDGGLLWCRTNDDHQRGKLLRWYGIDRTSPKTAMRCEEPIAEAGYKFHMNDLAATIGIEQLKYAEGILAAHRRIAIQYQMALPRTMQLNYRSDDRNPAFWVFTLRHPQRDAFVELLNEQGIGANRVHVRNDTHPCFEQFKSHLPGVDLFDATQFSIPCGWWLTETDTKFIIDAVCSAKERIKVNV